MVVQAANIGGGKEIQDMGKTGRNLNNALGQINGIFVRVIGRIVIGVIRRVAGSEIKMPGDSGDAVTGHPNRRELIRIRYWQLVDENVRGQRLQIKATPS